MSVRPLPPCFFCGKTHSDHRENSQGHPWRLGPSVVGADWDIADEATRKAYGSRPRSPQDSKP